MRPALCRHLIFRCPPTLLKYDAHTLGSMNSFRNNRLRDFAVPMSTNWLLNDLAEAKGKQELYTRQSPQLRAIPLRQSILSALFGWVNTRVGFLSARIYDAPT